MCSSQSTKKEQIIFEVPYMENAQDFVQHLMAVFYYLVIYPTLGNYHEDEVDGHVVQFDGIDIYFFHPEDL